MQSKRNLWDRSFWSTYFKMTFISTALFIILTHSSCFFKKQLASAKYNGKYGLIDKEGKFVVAPCWDYLEICSGCKKELILVCDDSLGCGYINRKGEVILKPIYGDAECFHEGIAVVRNNEEGDRDKCGFINKRGDTIAPFIFSPTTPGSVFSEGLCAVDINEVCGYINKKGAYPFPLFKRWDYLSDFYKGHAQIGQGKSGRIINKKGETVPKNQVPKRVLKYFHSLNYYRYLLETPTGHGVLNKNGDTVVPPIYLRAHNSYNGMHIVKTNSLKWGAYNTKGKLVVDTIYEALNTFGNGRSSFRINGKYGIINKRGKTIVAPNLDFEKVERFKNRRAVIMVNEKCGLINRRGRIVLKAIYDVERRNNYLGFR